jgi:predicted membrane-bound mannosyltransferase/sugar lactone lactonase YvrE
MTETGSVDQGSWLDRLLCSGFKIDRGTLVMAVLVILAVASRFYDVGARKMSHDETTHVYYSWNLYQGRGFQHNPLMHGPMQFHLWALSYFLFGDNDTAARIPTSVMGVAAVALTFVLRRWLGRTGSLVAGGLMLISPYMLYYSRYTREDPFVIPEALLMFWAIFAYFDTRKPRWLYLLAISLVLHFATKETAFIYAAQLLLFLAAYLGGELLRQRWERPGLRVAFLGGVVTAILGLGIAGYVFLRDRAEFSALMTPTPVSEEAGSMAALPPSPLMIVGAVIAVIGAGLIIASLVLAFGRRLRTDFPALDLLIVTGTLTLPQLGAMIAHILGWNPINYTDPTVVSKDAVVVVLLFAVSALVGLAWDWRRWLIAASSFWAIFLVLYTTIFTNGFGFLTGLVGSLGYWLEQQPVQRGTQPWFYYAFIQVPVYEYLPAIGVFLALVLGARALFRSMRRTEPVPADTPAESQSGGFSVPFFLGYWVISSVVAYSYAGEKMPWLTMHIALPMILLAGWAFGKALDGIDWPRIWNGKTWLDLAAIIVLIVALLSALGDLLGTQPPFQGTTLDQLQATTGFLVAVLAVVGAGAYLVLRRAGGLSRERWQLAGVVALVLLGVLTARTAFRAAFVNYDLAIEYLVYAHGAPGVNVVMDTIDNLATRTADGAGLDVAYDDQTSYPFMWYLRNYPRVHFFGGSPTRDLLNSPVVIVGAGNWSKVEPILGKRYYAFELHRLWWPNQDYWRIRWSSIESEHNSEQLAAGVPTTPMSTLEYLGRAWGRISPFFTDPAVRHAVWEIWINRDFTEWAALNNSDLSVENWNPTDKMKLYVRKDVAALLWDYGVTAAALDPTALEDPYAKGMIQLPAQAIVGAAGAEPGLFNAPRNIAVARDGSLYVADTFNHRIQHLAPDGTVLQVWGSFADASQTEAPGGTFNEPWGVAVAPDGTVYVADTWNHRVQRFTSTGTFLSMYGTFGQAESLTAFWGPRGVAVDRRGRVFVADTGNKRIVVFDSRGQGLTAMGEVGFGAGQLDEPVGVAVDSGGRVYVADTWNQRIQVFVETSPNAFTYDREWPVDAWYGQSLDNKPFLAAGPGDRVCASDPEAFRVLCFKSDGTFEFGWGEYGAGANQVGLLGGLAFGPQGAIWVADAGNARVMEFMPATSE